jgi:hypothetical protein
VFCLRLCLERSGLVPPPHPCTQFSHTHTHTHTTYMVSLVFHSPSLPFVCVRLPFWSTSPKRFKMRRTLFQRVKQDSKMRLKEKNKKSAAHSRVFVAKAPRVHAIALAGRKRGMCASISRTTRVSLFPHCIFFLLIVYPSHIFCGCVKQDFEATSAVLQFQHSFLPPV